jgi:spore maturation protein CgeB
MKILYAGSLTPNDSALYRMWALERLGHAVIPFDINGYELAHPVLRKVAFRIAAGPHIERLNRDLLRAAAGDDIAVLWADKVLGLQPSTLQSLRKQGVVTASYMIDNAFGPRRDPGWRLYMKCLREFDLHITQRDVSVRDYEERGARRVMKIQTAYEPTLHFPPPPGWTDANRTREVSFIGSPYDNRAEFLLRLATEFNVPVTVSGSKAWRAALAPEMLRRMFSGEDGLYHDAYREAIWASKINLSFLTHSNQDEYAHKSFEITACGGFLLAERSEGHSAKFREGEEAVFFRDIEECVAKIRQYLPDEAARSRIAAAGQRRAEQSGYGNDAQVERIVTVLEELSHSLAHH